GNPRPGGGARGRSSRPARRAPRRLEALDCRRGSRKEQKRRWTAAAAQRFFLTCWRCYWLLAVLGLRLLDALILGVATHRIALLLRHLVFRLHLRIAGVGHGGGGLEVSLGVRLGLVAGRLSFLDAHVLVVACLSVAGLLRGLVVGVGTVHRRVVVGLGLLLGLFVGGGRRVCAEGNDTADGDRA